MGKKVTVVNPDLEKKKEVSLREILTQAKARKKNQKGLGHISFAKETLEMVKKEVGKEEYASLGPGAAFYVVCTLLEKKKPSLYKEVMSKVGKNLYRSEVSQLYYRVRDAQ